MMTKRILITASLLGAGLVALDSPAGATCLDNAATTSPADNVCSSLSPCGNVRSSNIAIMAGDDDLQLSDDWGTRGNSNWCNTLTELAKHYNSFMLLTLGIDFDTTLNFNGMSYHSSACNGGDYCNLQSASSHNSWHNWFRQQALDSISGGSLAQFESRSGIGIPDLVQVSCLMYDNVNKFSRVLGEANPSLRAEAIGHEAWHAWEHSHGHPWDTACGHERCPSDPPNLTQHPFCQPGMECDTFYPHGSTTPGNMKNMMHRPYQVMSEFACDLVNTPADWVPLVAREIAKQDATFFGTHNIMNGPGPGCGASMNAGDIDGVCSNASNQCDQITPCSGGEICDGTTGCCTNPPACTITGSTQCDGVCACDFTSGCCPPPLLPPH
jgi:hypothetical protein